MIKRIVLLFVAIMALSAEADGAHSGKKSVNVIFDKQLVKRSPESLIKRNRTQASADNHKHRLFRKASVGIYKAAEPKTFFL